MESPGSELRTLYPDVEPYPLLGLGRWRSGFESPFQALLKAVRSILVGMLSVWASYVPYVPSYIPFQCVPHTLRITCCLVRVLPMLCFKPTRILQAATNTPQICDGRLIIPNGRGVVNFHNAQIHLFHTYSLPLRHSYVPEIYVDALERASEANIRFKPFDTDHPSRYLVR